MTGPFKAEDVSISFDDAQLRQIMRRQMLAAGQPAAEIDEAIDLGFHAARSAFQSAAAVCEHASSVPIRIATFSIALSLIKSKSTDMVEGFQDHFIKNLEDQGFAVNSKTIEVRMDRPS